MNQDQKIWDRYCRKIFRNLLDNVAYLYLYSEKIVYDNDVWIFIDNFEFSFRESLDHESRR